MHTPPDMKLSLYSLLKYVYHTGQRRHSLEVHPLLRKILDPPLTLLNCLPKKLQKIRVQPRNKELQSDLSLGKEAVLLFLELIAKMFAGINTCTSILK